MKTELERAMNEKLVPWEEENIKFKSEYYWVFKDAYPVTQGHLLFVPTEDTFANLFECIKAAYQYGQLGVRDESWDAFNIGQNVGEAAGQTVMYSHVHMIPRRKGDMEDPRGGVRHVIPEKGNYRVQKQNSNS
jgi:diadenosine tetraphosphate (Ap4A) HIT family hydrolase